MAPVGEAADGPLKGLLRVSDTPIVSRDILGDPASCVMDAPLTQAHGELVKVADRAPGPGRRGLIPYRPPPWTVTVALDRDGRLRVGRGDVEDHRWMARSCPGRPAYGCLS